MTPILLDREKTGVPWDTAPLVITILKNRVKLALPIQWANLFYSPPI